MPNSQPPGADTPATPATSDRRRAADAEVAAELADALHQLGHRLRRAAASELEGLGITGSQARALRRLARREPMRMSELARALDVVPRSVTTVVDGLESAGFAERHADPGDRRATQVALTDRGRQVLARLRSSRRVAAADLVGRLDGADQQELLRLLAVLNDPPRADGVRAGAGGGTRTSTPQPPAGRLR